MDQFTEEQLKDYSIHKLELRIPGSKNLLALEQKTFHFFGYKPKEAYCLHFVEVVEGGQTEEEQGQSLVWNEEYFGLEDTQLMNEAINKRMLNPGQISGLGKKVKDLFEKEGS